MEKRQVTRYFWIGAFALCLGVVYGVCIPFQAQPYGEGFGISGQTLPKLIASALILCGVLMMYNARKDLQRIKANPAAEEKPAAPLFSSSDIKRIGVYVVLLMVYLTVVPYLGFIVGTVPTLAAAMWLSGARNRAAIAGVSLISPPILYFAFAKLMEVPLPSGILI